MTTVKPSGARNINELSGILNSKSNTRSVRCQTWSIASELSSPAHVTRSSCVWKASSSIMQRLPMGQGFNEKFFSIISHTAMTESDRKATWLSSGENAIPMPPWYSIYVRPTTSQVVVSLNSTWEDCDIVPAIFPEHENEKIRSLSVSSWVFAATSRSPAKSSVFRLHMLTLPSLPPTKSLCPSRDGQIQVISEVMGDSISKIMLEPVIGTSHTSTVRLRGMNRKSVEAKCTTAGGMCPTSRLIDAISCVSNLQRQMWSGELNVATKESLVGEKQSDKR